MLKSVSKREVQKYSLKKVFFPPLVKIMAIGSLDKEIAAASPTPTCCPSYSYVVF